ncbi:MAG: CAP domain-containing protein [Methanoregulaceae archaeon]|nr:CAP domain-containing protein [Methanoregulaceae archaeon]
MRPGRTVLLLLFLVLAAGGMASAVQYPVSDIRGGLPDVLASPAVTGTVTLTGIPAWYAPTDTVRIPRIPAGETGNSLLGTFLNRTPRKPSFPIPGGSAAPFPWTGLRYGSLSVTTHPSGATIFLDGGLAGRSPALLPRVSQGSHHVGFLLPGYLPDSRDVTVIAGLPTTLDVALVPEDTPQAEPVPDNGGLTRVDAAIAKYTNIERTARGLAALAWDSDLARVAVANSRDMRDRHYFSHVNPDGHDVFWRLGNAGYSWKEAGENIAFSARYQADADPDTVGRALVRVWMESLSHRENILAPYYTRTGIGTVFEHDTTLTPHGYIVTQLFSDKD